MLATLLLLPMLWSGESRKADERETPAQLTRFVMRYGLATWVGTVGGVLVMRLDQVLLTPLAGPKELGYYAVAVSVAVTVWLPAVLSVTVNVPTPEVSVLFAGSAARASLLERATVPL